MTAFQPAPEADGLYFPSSLQEYTPGVYDPGDLVENPAGSLLYDFLVGDFAYPVLTPVPHVEMTIFELDPDCVTITAYRIVRNRSMVVPGQIRIPAAGGVNVVDWDAPFGVPLTYRSEQFDVDGNSLGFTRSFSTRLDVDVPWVQNVFDPAGGVQVTMAGQAAGSLKRSIPTDLHYPSGPGVAVAVSGQRHALEDVDVSFLTFSLEAADKVDVMFGDPYVTPSVPPVLCIRTPPAMRYPQPFYAHIADPVQVPLNLAQGGTLIRWEMTGTEVARPAIALINAVLTYEDRDLAYATYELMDAAYGSYLDMDRDYSLGGTAGTPDDTIPDTPATSTVLYGSGVYGAGIFGDDN